MANINGKQYLDSLKRNPDGTYYKILLKYAELRIEYLKDELMKERDMDEVKRIQGQALEMTNLLKGLTRKPVVNKFDGAFGQ